MEYTDIRRFVGDLLRVAVARVDNTMLYEHIPVYFSKGETPSAEDMKIAIRLLEIAEVNMTIDFRENKD